MISYLLRVHYKDFTYQILYVGIDYDAAISRLTKELELRKHNCLCFDIQYWQNGERIKDELIERPFPTSF